MRACVGAMVRACDAMRLGLGGHVAMRNAMRSDRSHTQPCWKALALRPTATVLLLNRMISLSSMLTLSTGVTL